MTNEIDFSKAPEGATHFKKFKSKDVSFFKVDGSNAYILDADYIGNTLYSDNEIWINNNLTPIPKPAKEDWFGKGELPPIGERCLKADTVVDVIAYIFNGTNKYAVFQNIEMNGGGYASEGFRPIKSERERTIEAALECCGKSGSVMVEVIMQNLYDAGMLKLPEDK